jgi:uncharacterized caspase-like protein
VIAIAAICSGCAKPLQPTPPGKVASLDPAPAPVVDPSRRYTEPESLGGGRKKPPTGADTRARQNQSSEASVVPPVAGPEEPRHPTHPNPPSPKAEEAEYRRKVAAVIGISRYTHLPKLEGARGDAEKMAKRLRAAGFDQVTELYDEAATQRAILNLLGTALPQQTDTNDLVVLFFAGHGQTETLPSSEKRGYIVPVDGEKDKVFTTSISMDQLRDLSNRIPAKHIYYAIDSCYSGMGFVRAVGPMETDGARHATTSARAVQMITAGSEGQQAREQGNQGLFTTYLLRAMDGDADGNGDGVLTASEIGKFVEAQVTAASQHRQTPQYGTLEGSGEVRLVVPR